MSDADGISIEVDLDATFDSFLSSGRSRPDPSDLFVEWDDAREQPICVSIDTSLSMTGEKLALTAVALGVVCLQFPRARVSVLSFEREAREIRSGEEACDATETLRRFFLSPDQGYTDLERGLKETLRSVQRLEARRGARPPAVLLLTDGKYTAGKDPTYLAPLFRGLHVLKMGADRSSESLCGDLARIGGGRLYRVEELRDLPSAMISATRDLLRGAALR